MIYLIIGMLIGSVIAVILYKISTAPKVIYTLQLFNDKGMYKIPKEGEYFTLEISACGATKDNGVYYFTNYAGNPASIDDRDLDKYYNQRGIIYTTNLVKGLHVMAKVVAENSKLSHYIGVTLVGAVMMGNNLDEYEGVDYTDYRERDIGGRLV